MVAAVVATEVVLAWWPPRSWWPWWSSRSWWRWWPAGSWWATAGLVGWRVTSTRVTALSRPAADPLRGQRPQLGVAAQPGVALEAVQVDQHRQLRAHPTGLGQPPGLQARRASSARASARR